MAVSRNRIASSVWADRVASYVAMLQRHADLRGLGGKCVRVALHWGARNTLAQTRRVACEQDDWRYRAISLLLVCGQTAWRITFVMSQRHADLRALGGKCVCVAPCHWGALKHAGVNAACRW